MHKRIKVVTRREERSAVELRISTILIYLSAQTAFYSLNPDRDIYWPLAINPAYIRLAANHITAQGVGCRASEGKWCGFVWHAPPILYGSTLLLLTQYFYLLNISKSNAT